MTEKAKAPFETVRPGCARFQPSLEKLLHRWAQGCDENPHSGARHILQASGYTFRSVGGVNYAVGLACPACEAAQVAERGEAVTPSCFLVLGSYRPKGSTPTSVKCAACGQVSKPSNLAETLYDSKPKRLAFLQKHCAGARPQEQRWVAARHDGKVVLADSAEAAMDEVADQFPKEAELCLCFGIEQPNVAELELPYVTVPLSERGEVKVLVWHGERVTPNEQARHAE
ncbi:MAG: hypothetical protein OEN21_03585 [Myxococcales bacterium]|nr:hypothetical protein [Myxococcales bacterium]